MAKASQSATMRSLSSPEQSSTQGAQAPTQIEVSDAGIPDAPAEVVEAQVVEPIDPQAQAVALRTNKWLDTRGAGPKWREVVGWIAAHAYETADVNAIIMEQLSERLLTAKTAEEILMPFAPQAGQDFLDEPIYIHSATYLESEYDEGFQWYVSLVITVGSAQDEKIITVGGEKVVMQVAGLDAGGFLPVYCMLTKSRKPTKAGFYPLTLTLVAK